MRPSKGFALSFAAILVAAAIGIWAFLGTSRTPATAIGDGPSASAGVDSDEPIGDVAEAVETSRSRVGTDA